MVTTLGAVTYRGYLDVKRVLIEIVAASLELGSCEEVCGEAEELLRSLVKCINNFKVV
jgi:hypothetical protein